MAKNWQRVRSVWTPRAYLGEKIIWSDKRIGFDRRIEKEGGGCCSDAYGWLLGSQHLTEDWQDFTQRVSRFRLKGHTYLKRGNIASKIENK